MPPNGWDSRLDFALFVVAPAERRDLCDPVRRDDDLRLRFMTIEIQFGCRAGLEKTV